MRHLHSALGLALAGTALAAPVGAQQYVVDDAAIVEFRACQAEAWHGRRSSWILPACQLLGNLEISAGVGFLDEGGGVRETEYAVEAKTLFRPLEPDGWGMGLVVGVGPNPSAAPGERHLSDVYAFAPASLSLWEDGLVLHGNLGWAWERRGEDEEDQHLLTWGARADAALVERFTAIGEVYGYHAERPEFQVGIRTHFPEAGVEVDVSWGGSTERGLRGAGLTVGIAFVSRPLF